MVRWGDGVLIVKKAKVGTWRGNQTIRVISGREGLKLTDMGS